MHLHIPDDYDIAGVAAFIQQDAARQHHRARFTWNRDGTVADVHLTPQWICDNERQLPLGPNVIPLHRHQARPGERVSPWAG